MSAAQAIQTTPGRAVAAVAPAIVLVIGMVAAVNLAIPTLQAGSLHPSVSQTAWVVDSYTLVFACLLIPAGALGDRFGRRRGMLAGLLVLAAGSVMAALAQSVEVLMCGRALSGIGAAFVLPATLAVTLGQLQPSQRARGVALWSALTGAGGAVGNVGGGVAVELGGWRTLFWAGVPIALAAAALIAARVPEQTPHRLPVDPGGGGLLTAGTLGVLYAIIESPEHGWGSTQVLVGLAAGVALLVAFAVYESRLDHPMLDPRLFAVAGVRAGALGIVALFFALFGLFYVNSQYLQDVKGYSALLSGVCALPIALAMPFASARSPRLAARFGGRATIVAGMGLVAAGLALMSLAAVATPYSLYALLLVLVGAGMGLAMPPLSGLMVDALPAHQSGVAAGLNSTTRELGSALGVAVLSTLLATRFSAHLPDALRRLPGGREEAVGHSITAALNVAHRAPDPVVRAELVHGVRQAFTHGTSLGLRAGAALILATTVVVAHQRTTKGND